MDMVKQTAHFFTGMTLSCLLFFAASAPAAPPPPPSSLTLSQVPLYLVGNVSPNIMLMLDNSGSMSNIVPETPYDASTTYIASCTGANLIPAGGSVEITIPISLPSSLPKIRYCGASSPTSCTTSYTLGTGSGQKCFDTTATYSARLNLNGISGNTTVQGGYLDADYTGNYLNWYFNASNTTPAWTTAQKKPGTQSRIEIARTSAKSLVDSLGNIRLGLSTYNDNNTTNGGSLREIIGDVDAAKKADVKTKIDLLTASASTPLAETLSDIGRYFATGATGSLTLHPGKSNQTTASVATVFTQGSTSNHNLKNDSGQTIVNPIQYSCQKSFAVLMTDGRPQQDRAISASLRDYTGDCAASPSQCNATPNTTNLPSSPLTVTTFQNGTKVGRTYEPLGSDYLDDVAQGLFEMDLRPDLSDSSGGKNNIVTYTIGFADTTVANDPLLSDTATKGGGLFISAENSTQLSSAFQAALVDITEKVSAASSVALNSGSISSDSHLYQAKFTSSTWNGQLLSFPVQSDPALPNYGTLGPQSWDAGALLKAQDPNTRKILTYKPSTKTGIPFQWPAIPATPGVTEIDASQVSALNTDPVTGFADTPTPRGSERLAFLRGTDASGFRSRGGSKLGDIVYSSPAFVGAPRARYPDDWGSGEPETAPPNIDPAYSKFKLDNGNRTDMVYVGANDGMLHGFDANTGAERLAYVPGVLFKDLSKLTNPNYGHRFYVDGSPTVGDAFFGSAWHTVLVGGLRGGGQGIYALDITDPPGTSATEADIAGNVLWEFTDANDPDLGFTYSEPNIVRMHNGKWAAVFGNGYNNTASDGLTTTSTTGNAVLYIVDIADGTLIAKIDTMKGYLADPKGSNRPNGLATPAPIDTNGDHIVDYIYAGDLFGNLWKFDVKALSASGWKVAYGSTSAPEPLYTACAGTTCTTGATSNYQPITTRPEVGRHPTQPDGYMVYFGTGKYIEAGDGNPPPPAQTDQSFYGIWDQNKTSLTAFGRSDLRDQQITKEVPQTYAGKSYDLRVTTKNAIDWTPKPTGAGHLGWYMDLINTGAAPPNNAGEKQVTDSILRNGRIIFTTLIPSVDPCDFGGTGWLMELDADTGGQLDAAPFDLNGDGIFNKLDYVDLNGDGIPDVPPSGKKSTVGIPSQPGVASGSGEKHKGKEFKYITGSKGDIETTIENAGEGYTGRTSWRELYLQ